VNDRITAPGGAAAVVYSRARAAALPTPIRDARMPQAIGQSFDLTGSLPQKQKSSAPGLLIGQRHFPWLSSSSVHPRPL
jgi:hypothetical protein